ncbi:hypothetical protein BDW67DRAFT_184664 [Aspergillus spinulosporus]
MIILELSFIRIKLIASRPNAKQTPKNDVSLGSLVILVIGAVQAPARVRKPDPVVADRPCVCCLKNLFVLDKATGKVIGPAVCKLKRRRAKRCTRCMEGNKKCVLLPALLVGRALALAQTRRTREAVHQTLELRYDIDAELKKAESRESYRLWHQVQLFMQYHTFQLRNKTRALKNIAPVPASEMLVNLDEFKNTMARVCL